MGVSYRIEVTPAALRALKRIDKRDADRIRGAIALLGEDPRPPGAIALRGRAGYRVRVGNYRILYTVDDGVLVVVIVALGHRREVYRS
ncbi:mRNA interferase RelE/StbE [Microcella alkaliphila]|uniref:mRNA interferase RelE/StbE n=1 Tax=Microcella alkaliphila TaxID=279828 RepID=A0A4Q7TG95_9MICO|nr:mRNA interferase RelE/StbE [Microcella alkaliphila]